MDFSMDETEQQRSFRRMVRAWIAERAPTIHGNRDSDEHYEALRTLGRQLGEMGWLYPMAPVEYGGSGMPAEWAVIIAQELHARDLSLPPYPDPGGALAGQCVAVWGTEEQKQRILPRILRGEALTLQLLTEPEGGSDLATTSTTARRDGDEYVVNGVKTWVAAAHPADYMWTITRTGPEEERYRNLSWFMIPANLPGIVIKPMNFLDGSNKSTVYLQDVRVSADDLIGGENLGWRVAQTFLALKHGRSGSPEAHARL